MKLKFTDAEFRTLRQALRLAIDFEETSIDACTPKLGMDFDTPGLAASRRRSTRWLRRFERLLTKMKS